MPHYGNEAIAPYFFLIIFGAALIAVGYVLLPFLGDMVIALWLCCFCRGTMSACCGRWESPVLASGITVAVLMVVWPSR